MVPVRLRPAPMIVLHPVWRNATVMAIRPAAITIPIAVWSGQIPPAATRARPANPAFVLPCKSAFPELFPVARFATIPDRLGPMIIQGALRIKAANQAAASALAATNVPATVFANAAITAIRPAATTIPTAVWSGRALPDVLRANHAPMARALPILLQIRHWSFPGWRHPGRSLVPT